MRRQIVTKLVMVVAVLFVVAISTPRQVKAQGNFTRLVSEFQNFSSSIPFFDDESSTTAGALANGGGGTVVYTKPIFFGADATTGYFTISATGDTHNGAAEFLTLVVDGVAVDHGTAGAGGAPSGWINVQKHFNYNTKCGPAAGATCWNGNKFVVGDGGFGGGAGDMHDNSINYQWCYPVTPGVHTLTLKMATSQPGDPVFFEAAHVYIDSSDSTGPRCQKATGAL